jgi:hypothetical protein
MDSGYIAILTTIFHLDNIHRIRTELISDITEFCRNIIDERSVPEASRIRCNMRPQSIADAAKLDIE